MDTYEGEDTDPLSLHKYLYANADPVDGRDPSGNDDIAEITMSVAVQTGLGAMSGVMISTALFGYASYNALAKLPQDAFTTPPAATMVGFQASRSLSDFVPESSPFLSGLAAGLSFTSGVGGVEALFPSFTNTAWFYIYAGGWPILARSSQVWGF